MTSATTFHHTEEQPRPQRRLAWDPRSVTSEVASLFSCHISLFLNATTAGNHNAQESGVPLLSHTVSVDMVGGRGGRGERSRRDGVRRR